MATQFLLTRDIAGYPTTGEQTCTRFTDTAQYFTLTGSTVEDVTVPSVTSPHGRPGRLIAKFKLVSLTENAVVWVLPSDSPVLTLPTGTVTATTAEMNPSCREVTAGQSLQLLTSQADVSVSITYYEIL